MKVSDAMTKEVVVCMKSDTALTAAVLMKSHGIGAIPVVTDLMSKKLEGIITDRDLCIRLVAENGTPDSTKVGVLMTRDPIVCLASDPLEKCERLMREGMIRRIPVVNEQGQCVGIVAQADIVLHDNPDNVDQMLVAISKPRHGVYTTPRAIA